MENKLQFADHPKFGKLRYLVSDGKVWFVAADVCRVLEIGNPSQAIKRLRQDEKMSVVFTPDGVLKNGVTNTLIIGEGTNNANYGLVENRLNIINEPGFYRLVFASRKEEAIEIQDWVYHEVLPSINATGSYSLVKPEPTHVPNPNRRAGQFKDACVYVAKVNNNTVKVGQSCNVKKRRADIKSKHKLILGETHKTARFPRKIARVIEQAFKDIFSSSKLNGEFFSVSFDTACNVLNALEKLIESLPIVSDKECDNKLLKISEMISETSERQNLLTNAADIFVDKKPD